MNVKCLPRLWDTQVKFSSQQLYMQVKDRSNVRGETADQMNTAGGGGREWRPRRSQCLGPWRSVLGGSRIWRALQQLPTRLGLIEAGEKGTGHKL